MTNQVNSGHPGGSMSAVEIITALYFAIMQHDPERADWPERDRFILSKGHATPVIYRVMAEAGYFPVEELMTFRRLGSPLQGHVICGKPPGVEMSAGALGMGLSFSLGQALAGRLDRLRLPRFCLLSDGDSQEGQTWEAAMAAGTPQGRATSSPSSTATTSRTTATLTSSGRRRTSMAGRRARRLCAAGRSHGEHHEPGAVGRISGRRSAGRSGASRTATTSPGDPGD